MILFIVVEKYLLFDLTSQRYMRVNSSFRKTGMNGIFCFTTGKVCIMSGSVNEWMWKWPGKWLIASG